MMVVHEWWYAKRGANKWRPVIAPRGESTPFGGKMLEEGTGWLWQDD
jgi:hypothetical protein